MGANIRLALILSGLLMAGVITLTTTRETNYMRGVKYQWKLDSEMKTAGLRSLKRKYDEADGELRHLIASNAASRKVKAARTFRASIARLYNEAMIFRNGKAADDLPTYLPED